MKTFQNNTAFFTSAIISILAIIVLSAYITLFLPPKFTELIVENTKNEAVRVSNHLVSLFSNLFQGNNL